MAPDERTRTPSRGALPRVLIVSVSLAAAVVVVAGMRAAAGIVGPAFLALVIAVAASPMQRWLVQRIPRWAATLTCLVVIFALVIALALAMIVSVVRLASLLPEYQADFDQRVSSATGWLQHLGISQAQLDNLQGSLDLGRLGSVVSDAVTGVFGALSTLVFLLMLIIFMTVDAASFPGRLAAAANHRPGMVAALGGFAHTTRRYLIVSTVFGLIVAVLDTIGLVVMGIPAPVLWGLLAFLTNYIPNVGFIIGLVPPALLALLQGGPGLMLGVIALYCVLNLIIQSIIQPKVVGDSVGLSTTLTFLSLVFWSWVLGPLGAILAVPMSLLVRAVLVDADPDSAWLRPLVANSDDVGPG